MAANRKIFVNLPVRDLKRSMAFFGKLGFEFNLQFTDESAACMIVSEEAFVMLLTEPRFRDFTPHELCDTRTHTEALVSVSCESRAEVDRMVSTAIDAGGEHAMPVLDMGFMYGWSFYDLDGHHWEVVHIDMSALPPQ